MISAFLLIGRLLREEKKSKKPVQIPEHYENFSIHNEDSLKVNSVASGGTLSIDLPKVDKKLTLLNLVFSASGMGKYRILKNGVAIATLFSEKKNVFYQGEIKLKKGDDLRFEFINLDRQAMDMYVGFDAKR